MRMRAMLLMPLAVILAGCASTTPPVVTDLGCIWTRTIRWSAADTLPTIEQVTAHNRARAGRCQGDDND